MKIIQRILYLIIITTTLTACNNTPDVEEDLQTNSIADTSPNTITNMEPVSTSDDIHTEDNVITDIASWSHPVKDIIQGPPFELYKLELINKSTYPKFYVNYPDDNALKDEKKIKSLLDRIAAANGYWDYELINEKDNVKVQVLCNRKSKQISKILMNGVEYYSEDQVQDKNQDQHNSLQLPQIYQDFIRQKDLEDNESIVFFVKEDIDLDGTEEAIIATGYSDQDLEQIYLLRNQNGTIEQLGDNLNNGGYFVYEIKLIRLKDRSDKVIYLGLTNSANLTGFQIVALINQKPTVICYSASATGAGDDELRDFDLDGEYDGYVQHRWSYDVLHYSVMRTFTLDQGEFKLSSTSVEIPDYPNDTKEVVLEYLSLKAIASENSPEVDKRLSELCQYCTERNKQVVSDIWYEAVYRSIAKFEDSLNVDIHEENNTAKVILSFTDEDKKEYLLNFHLIKADGKWTIDEIH